MPQKYKNGHTPGIDSKPIDSPCNDPIYGMPEHKFCDECNHSYGFCPFHHK